MLEFYHARLHFAERGSTISAMTEFQPTIEKVTLTPLTVGQFNEGDLYGTKGVVVSESPTEIKVCYSQNFENCHGCPLNDSCPVMLVD